MRLPRNPKSPRRFSRKLSIELLESRDVPTVFSVSNFAATGPGSLRQAILDANADPFTGEDQIEFTTGAGTIALSDTDGPLPTFTRTTVIDGSSATGFSGTPIIVIDGSALSSGDGLTISSAGNTIKALSIVGFGNGSGIVIGTFGSSGVTNNQVIGCFLGVDASGSTAVANDSGIRIDNGATNTTVGGLTAADRNIISGNSEFGIELNTSSGNVIVGNFIGLDSTGLTAVPNRRIGIILGTGTHDNLIGGTASGARNVISANVDNAILIDGVGVDNNQIEGNFIGPNATGLAKPTNSGNFPDAGAIVISNGAQNNTIGGTDAGAGNVISGNASNAVTIANLNSNGNKVQGNLIGTTPDGMTALPNSGIGVRLVGGAQGNLIGGTTASARNVISANTDSGFLLVGDSLGAPNGNLIQGNFIGVNASGATALGNGNFGLLVVDGSHDNTIGGTAAGGGNVISGNANSGISLFSSGVTGNLVQGNLIGTNAAGTAAVPNNGAGVRIGGGAIGNTIGGTSTGARNVISGNSGSQVAIVETGTSNNTVQGNFIGPTAAGTSGITSTSTGIDIGAGADNNTIGGTASGAGNLISANGDSGLTIESNGNTVQGNFIGTDAAGANALGNPNNGIALTGNNNTIGGTATGASNVISSNGSTAIFVGGSGNAIQGNKIGTDFTGTNNLGNLGEGIVFNGSNNTAGGTATGAGNTIAFNSIGVRVFGTVNGNAILGNSIFSNTGLGIQLDAPAGNNLQAGPVLTRAITNATITTFSGTLHSVPNSTFRIEFFSNAAADAGGAGEGQTFLGSTNVTTDASGNASFQTPLSLAVTPGQAISATATDSANNTSQFAVDVTANTVFVPVPVGNSISATEGASFTTQLTSFTTDDSSLTLSDFSATISWGDNTTSAGVVSGSAGSFTVSGTHTYAEEGNRTFSVTIQDTRDSLSTSTSGAAAVADAALTAGALTPPNATERLGFTNVILFHFTDANPGATASDFSALITWGDGTTSTVTGSMTANGAIVAAAGGGFNVLGSHTYPEELTNVTFSVQVNDIGGASTSAGTSTFNVADAPLGNMPTSVQGVVGTSITGVVAVFTDAEGPESINNYSATIDWGDGTAKDNGTISPAGLSFFVNGSHIYTATGTFTVTVTIRDVGGSQTTAKSSAIITNGIGTNERFVAAAYRTLLHREQDPNGAAFWLGVLNQGISRQDVALGFQQSKEFRVNLVWNFYRRFLERIADDFGLNASIAFLAAGGTDEQVEAEIIGSPEYFQRNGGTNDAFLTAVYRDLFHRDVDSGARAAYGQALAANVSRIALAQTILTSTEAFQGLVDQLYMADLARHADPGGLVTFTDALQKGARDEDVNATLVGSAEYFSRV